MYQILQTELIHQHRINKIFIVQNTTKKPIKAHTKHTKHTEKIIIYKCIHRKNIIWKYPAHDIKIELKVQGYRHENNQLLL